MLRNLIRLSNGTEISSGSNAAMNIRSCTITHCVNSGDELTIGSVCAACVEMVVQTPPNTFRSDDVFTLYKVDDAGNRTQIGIFNVFEPEEKGDHLYKVTAYDNVIKLDKDLTERIREVLASNHLNPFELSRMVCEECGVVLGDYPLYDAELHAIIQPTLPSGSITGRKLLQWIAEMLGYFCVADSNGELAFRWYVDKTNIILSETGSRFRMKGSYKWKNHILPIDSVRVIGSNGTHRSSTIDSIGNQYVIKDNPFLDGNASVKHAAYILKKFLDDHRNLIGDKERSIVACEVSLPATLDIRAGDVIVVDEQEPEQDEVYLPQLLMRVMSKISKGQKDTLQCVGSYRRRN